MDAGNDFCILFQRRPPERVIKLEKEIIFRQDKANQTCQQRPASLSNLWRSSKVTHIHPSVAPAHHQQQNEARIDNLVSTIWVT